MDSIDYGIAVGIVIALFVLGRIIRKIGSMWTDRHWRADNAAEVRRLSAEIEKARQEIWGDYGE